MDDKAGIDVRSASSALQAGGLMPPVSDLHLVHDVEGDEALLITVLTPCHDDTVSEIASALRDVPHEIRYEALTVDGRRPGADYRA